MNTQFNVENKWYIFADEIRSVSGDLALVNNVDVSGTLKASTINDDTITLSTNSNGDINLTANGNGDVIISPNLKVSNDITIINNGDITTSGHIFASKFERGVDAAHE